MPQGGTRSAQQLDGAHAARRLNPGELPQCIVEPSTFLSQDRLIPPLLSFKRALLFSGRLCDPLLRFECSLPCGVAPAPLCGRCRFLLVFEPLLIVGDKRLSLRRLTLAQLLTPTLRRLSCSRKTRFRLRAA